MSIIYEVVLLKAMKVIKGNEGKKTEQRHLKRVGGWCKPMGALRYTGPGAFHLKRVGRNVQPLSVRLLLREEMRAMVVTLWLNQGGTAFSTSLTALVRSEAFFIF